MDLALKPQSSAFQTATAPPDVQLRPDLLGNSWRKDKPSFMQDPHFSPTANGCGPDASPWVTAFGNLLYPEFKDACDVHDTGSASDPGYATEHGDKDAADLNFLDNMTQACDTAHPYIDAPDGIMDHLRNIKTGLDRGACKTDATKLYLAVHAFGGDAFQSGQKDAELFGEAPNPNDRFGFEFNP